MERLAQSCLKEDLADQAYSLYERFRPVIPGWCPGVKGAGIPNLDRVLSLARRLLQGRVNPGTAGRAKPRPGQERLH